MSLKEKIGAATNARSLAWDEEGSERAVDRLAAVGLAQVRVSNPEALPEDRVATTRGNDELAGCLWRLKYGADESRGNYSQAFHGVLFRVHPRRRPSYVLRAIVAIAIEEWRVETCPACHGRKFVGGAYDLARHPLETKTKVCEACSGLGIRQRKDEDRANAVMNLLRRSETDRLRRSTRVVLAAGSVFVVTARPEHIPDLHRVWGRGWGSKYQEALEVIVGLDARLGSRIRRKLEEERS